MKRRTLIAGISAGLSAGGLGLAVMAEQVRNGLLDLVGEDIDWNAVRADYERRMVVDPSPSYGTSLLGHLTVARQQAAELGATPERLQAIAALGHLYALYCGNLGDITSARGWYRTAITLADRSGHTDTHVYCLGRFANRAPYEGGTVRETLAAADKALALSRRPTRGAVEAYSARVHVAGLTGDVDGARTAVIGMRNVAETLADADTVGGPIQKAALFDSYVESKLGTFDQAQRAFDAAVPVLRTAPLWLADARTYYARAIIGDGAVAEGISYALASVKSIGRQEVQTLAIGVADCLTAVPSGYSSDDLDELRTYAAVGPMPWDTLA
jgi:hypothetical protein